MAAKTRATGPSPSSRADGPSLPTLLAGGALLNQVGRELGTALDRAFARFGLTTQQAALLLHVADQPTSPSRLTDALGTDTAGMTRLLDRLETKGLLRRQRHAQDRRAITIEVTDTGRDLLPHLPPIFGRANTQLFDGFSTEEIIACTAMLQRMLTNLAGIDQPS
ncbi:MarR family winged helix-turn-helix transcriptional regulator [Nonomuraea basaltis]|uniref:MarR family winged helix-turn-helix transcriptional regulator n=1 Tax=Nonomuraea basaltis TaxID=2495887 RepID=UPI00110C45EF|nr:MarR family transcriptional regulator [Nonomuraea basaltis]TMR91565.1 MarR family transcriptional regulator [Nonomuraea basaltis]